MLDIPAAIREAAGVVETPPVRIFVVRNGSMKSESSHVVPRLLPIAGRAVSDLLFTQSVGDLYRIYAITQRDGIEYNLAYIPDDFESNAKEVFDREAMRRLFDLAHGKAIAGYPWQKLPPGLARSAPAATSQPQTR